MNDTPRAANVLAGETSPYLLQHRDNPVHWRPWGEAALAEARARDVPILLSIGYAACHWCHVMAHESFEDEATAALMNALFVNIKVDREERPDLDAIYQAALALMGEQGGWPLTMFLTPAGEPFWGGTYFPPEPRYGRAAFRDVLRALSDAWAEKREQVARNVTAIGEALRARSLSRPGDRPTLALVDAAAERLAQEVDPVHGGIKGAPKFPQTAIFALIWRVGRRRRDEELKRLAVLTLERMAQGGIYDHLGGGFARYSTDALWLAPHFEKMLYDNAELVELMTMVWREVKSPLLAARIDETIGWLGREMMAEGGAFAASFDADSEGEEGRFYVWSEAEIDRLLGAEARRFKDAYDVTQAGNWEGHVILNRSRTMLLGEEAHEAALARSRAVLFAARAKRVPPARDDKVLADWNGLMIAALAKAGFAFARADWIDLARAALTAIETRMIDADGRLRHSLRLGRARHAATLDDHAALARAALALAEASGDRAPIALAERLVALADRHYWDREAGGYFLTADDAGDLIVRTKNAYDNATPSGNAMMAEVLARLHLLTGRSAYRDRAEAVIAAFAGDVARNVFPFATLLGVVDLLERPLQVVVVGAKGDARREALLRAIAGHAPPSLVLAILEPGDSLPEDHPARGKGLVGGAPAAYVCEGPVCSAPITAAGALAADLDRR